MDCTFWMLYWEEPPNSGKMFFKEAEMVNVILWFYVRANVEEKTENTGGGWLKSASPLEGGEGRWPTTGREARHDASPIFSPLSNFYALIFDQMAPIFISFLLHWLILTSVISLFLSLLIMQPLPAHSAVIYWRSFSFQWPWVGLVLQKRLSAEMVFTDVARIYFLCLILIVSTLTSTFQMRKLRPRKAY